MRSSAATRLVGMLQFGHRARERFDAPWDLSVRYQRRGCCIDVRSEGGREPGLVEKQEAIDWRQDRGREGREDWRSATKRTRLCQVQTPQCRRRLIGSSAGMERE